MSDEIESLVRKAIREELACHSHTCRFAVNDEDARDMGEYMRMLSFVGDGSLAKGVDVIRENHKWLKTQRDRSNRISSAIVIILVTTALGGIFSAMWLGFRTLVVGGANVR